MREFDFDHELVLLEGIRRGLGDSWAHGQEWITVVPRRGILEVSMSPPASKKMFRIQELFLSQMDEGDLYKAGLIVGFEMAKYLNKYQRFIDPSALAWEKGEEGDAGKRGVAGRAK